MSISDLPVPPPALKNTIELGIFTNFYIDQSDFKLQTSSAFDLRLAAKPSTSCCFGFVSSFFSPFSFLLNLFFFFSYFRAFLFSSISTMSTLACLYPTL